MARRRRGSGLRPHPPPLLPGGGGQEALASGISWRERMPPPLRRLADLVAGVVSAGEAWARRVAAALRDFFTHHLAAGAVRDFLVHHLAAGAVARGAPLEVRPPPAGPPLVHAPRPASSAHQTVGEPLKATPRADGDLGAPSQSSSASPAGGSNGAPAGVLRPSSSPPGGRTNIGPPAGSSSDDAQPDADVGPSAKQVHGSPAQPQVSGEGCIIGADAVAAGVFTEVGAPPPSFSQQGGRQSPTSSAPPTGATEPEDGAFVSSVGANQPAATSSSSSLLQVTPAGPAARALGDLAAGGANHAGPGGKGGGRRAKPVAVELGDSALSGRAKKAKNVNGTSEEDNKEIEAHNNYFKKSLTCRKNSILCLICHLENKNAEIMKDDDAILTHCKSKHKGEVFWCHKKGCFVVAKTKHDIGIHENVKDTYITTLALPNHNFSVIVSQVDMSQDLYHPYPGQLSVPSKFAANHQM
ncbi:hypothetical protein EJB05_27431, partial [Eragrostis curvula]